MKKTKVMKKLLFGLCLSFAMVVNGQTILYNDNCETIGYNWYGYPISGLYSMYFGGTTALVDRPSNKPLYVSSSNSFGLYGFGTTTYETEIYQLPNITGLNPSKIYRFKFRLMAYAENIVTGAGSGLDNQDYVEVRISTNNGASYINESRITGFGDSYWSFNATGAINEIANGVLNTYSPIANGNQETTGYGYSTYSLSITGVNQLSVRIFMRANYGGSNYGEWWVIDDMELIEELSLPIELTEFTGYKTNGYNVLKWQTASEHNNSHFTLERSTTGEFTENDVITTVTGAENSTEIINYSYRDFDAPQEINYYRLTQVDYDGNFKQYGPISIDNRDNRVIIKYINILGQDVNQTTSGIVFEVYEDGTLKKVWNP
jgi:hypothetical protein